MRLPILVCSLLAVTACSGDDPHVDEPVNCDLETRDDEFVVGLTKAGQAGVLEFKLMSATPAPPARDDNTWVLQVNATGGSPVTGAAMTATPFMPDHQHGSGKNVVVEPMTEAGQYRLAPVNLWMPGLGEPTISASSASATDQVVFKFCIPS